MSLPTTLLSSSVVERSAVNRLVVGSNPTSGAIFFRRFNLNSEIEDSSSCSSSSFVLENPGV